MVSDKNELRSEMASKRDALAPEIRRQKSELICERAKQLFFVPELEKWNTRRRKPVIFTYLPFRSEVDVMPLIQWFWKSGFTVLAPKTLPAEKAMRLHTITGTEDLAPGVWGIPEPRPETPAWQEEPISYILVPGIAFSPDGGRLGYGGGYYDRFMIKLARSVTSASKLALAFDLQMVPELPMESHDFSIDCILTESRFLHIDS